MQPAARPLDPQAESTEFPEAVWHHVWRQLARATRDARHAFRHAVVATRCPRRVVRTRTVVLREADVAASRLAFHSDRRSEKVDGLVLSPQASWCFYDRRRRTQVRAETRASLHLGDAVARSAWDAQGEPARRLLRIQPPPGSPLPDAGVTFPEDGPAAGFENFVSVVCDVVELEWLQLDRHGHRRLRFEPGPDGIWRGAALVP